MLEALCIDCKLLEGYTFLCQYSTITRTPFESSRLGELKYAISAGWDVILTKKSIQKCKKGIAQSAYMVTVLRTGSDSFGHAVSTSLHGLPPNFTHALIICLGRFLSPFRSARLMGSGGNSPSSRFSWRKVWTVVNCNFSSAQLHYRYVVGKLPISRVWMWNFTRIRRKTKSYGFR